MFLFGFLGRKLKQGDGGTTPTPTTVPKVLSSIIPDNFDHGIDVVFDQPITFTKDAHLAISAIINGGTPIQAIMVVSNPTNSSEIGFIFPDSTFTYDDVITWSYNDQHPTAEIKGGGQYGKEIDNQTYTVTNSIKNTRWISENSENWLDENGNEWLVN